MPEATAVQERPIAEDYQELKRIGEDVDSQITYTSEAARNAAKAHGVELPGTKGELYKALGEKAEELVADNERKKEERKEKVPDIILREENEEGWERLGWTKRDREIVKDKLREKLFPQGTPVDEGRLENILHMLIASGKTPQDVLPVINDASNWNYYDLDQPGNEAISSLTNNILQGNPNGARRYLYLTEKLGLTNEANSQNDVYIRRFVLDTDFHNYLEREYVDLPQNLFDVAWNIMYRQPEKYGPNGTFPILQMQIRSKKDKNGNLVTKLDKEGNPLKDKNNKPLYETEGRYVVNQANFVVWLRERMYSRYDVFETQEVPDFYSTVTAGEGKSQMYQLNLNAMIFDKNTYFRDETGYVWDDLFSQVFVEPWMLQYDRIYALNYYNAKGGADSLIKAYTEMAAQSKFTRKVMGQSMLDRSLMLPVEFTGNDSDAKMGDAVLTMYLAYYNLADFDGLVEYLGKDSEFFKRETWINAAKKIAGSTMQATGGSWMSTIFGEREDSFYKAFDKEGNLVDKKAFIKLINPYYQETVPQSLERALAEVLKESVKEKFMVKNKQQNKKDDPEKVLDEASLDNAWLKAYSWMYFTGGFARNNFVDSGGPAGYIEDTKYFHTDAYRLKYETYGGAGMQYTDFMFKQLGNPLLEGMLLENAFELTPVGYDENGKPRFEKKRRYRTPMEVMQLMRKRAAELEGQIKGLQGKIKPDTDKDTRETIEKQIARLEDEAKNYTKSFASKLEFGDMAFKVWTGNVLARGSTLYNTVMKGKETSFDKFIKYDSVFRGVSFNREEWQEALQENLITPVRYFFEANGATQLNSKTRAPVLVGWEKGKPQWEWKEQYLGERMMGHQILDIPQFRMTAKDATDKRQWEKGWRKKGKYIADENGRFVIDYDKVQADKTTVWKQWMLMKIAGDLWAHIDRHSTDPAYGMDHYMNVLESVENLHGNVSGNEYDMKGVRITEGLFSKEQMKWLKQISGTTGTRLFTRQFFTDIFVGDKRKKESLLGESASIILSSIFRGT